jgi:ActR/RegA family two-component response regulator
LIVENDNNFAHFLFDMAHERGYKAVVVGRGAAAIQRARETPPHRDHARHQPAGLRRLAVYSIV